MYLRTTSVIGGLLAAGALLLPVSATAATITGWNTSNVQVGPSVGDGESGASVIYQDDAQTITNGQIVYTGPEANTPGVKIEGGEPSGAVPYDGTQKQTFDGCIMTSSDAYCNSPFQSGKRIKQQITSAGPIDLVFNVAPTDDTTDASGAPLDSAIDTSVYQVFYRLINVTGGDLSGFTLELGTGVGDGADGFQASTTDDGLRFATTDASLNPNNPLTLGPDKLTSFSQYPYGLFGGEPLNPNPLALKGFFDTGAPLNPDGSLPDDNGRAGFEVTQNEDSIVSGAYYGTYDDLFGNWRTQSDVPEGLFWDYAFGAADPLLMAWQNSDGLWEVRRDILSGIIDPATGLWKLEDVIAGTVLSLDMAEWQTFATATEVANFFDLKSMLEGPIEDLANLNVSYGIEISDLFARTNQSFTLRVTPTAAAAPVPLPAGAPLMLAAMAAFGLVARRRRAAA